MISHQSKHNLRMMLLKCNVILLLFLLYVPNFRVRVGCALPYFVTLMCVCAYIDIYIYIYNIIYTPIKKHNSVGWIH